LSNKKKHNWDMILLTKMKVKNNQNFMAAMNKVKLLLFCSSLFHFNLMIFDDDEILCHPMLVRSPWVVQKHSTQCCLSVCNSLSLCCVMFFYFLFFLWLLILVSWVGGTLSPHQRRDIWLQNSGWWIGAILNWWIMVILNLL